MAACRNRNFDMVNLLLGYKADLQAKDENGETALVHAKRTAEKKVIDLLLSAGAK